MKIKKFNENNSTFDFNEQKLQKLCNDYFGIRENIEKYLQWLDAGTEHELKKVFVKYYEFGADKDDIRFWIFFDTDDETGLEYDINQNDLEQFLNFINNPDAFINAKKFNI